MNRNLKPVYCFLYDDSKRFYRATQSPNGNWTITSNSQMYPLYHNPDNLKDSPVEFNTNRQYFSMNRSINYPLRFTFDGAAILNYKYHNGKGFNENLYFAMFEFDPKDGIYKLSYNGKIDFQQKKRNEKLATFTVPVVDDTAWGVLSQNDDVEYSFDCSETNPLAIKVLIDNFTLKNRLTYQTVAAPITVTVHTAGVVIPFVLVNQDGDSSGIVSKGQTSEQYADGPTYDSSSLNYFMYSYYDVTGVRFQGSVKFNWSITGGFSSAGLTILFTTSKGQVHEVFIKGRGELVAGQTYSFDFDFTLDLEAGEKVFFKSEINDDDYHEFAWTPVVTNIFVSLLTKVQPAIVYGLRPLDLLKAIVGKATLQRYTIDSTFFTVNNKTVLVPGESARGLQDSKIYTSFKDFFDTFSALFFMALRVSGGSLFMELADEVYKRDTNIIDLGDLIECETEPAVEYEANELEVGSPKQDYRHPSGRLEFNAPEKFSFPFTNIKKKLNLKTRYRTDCYGLIFLLLDYRGASTEDNIGDTDTWVVDITDILATAVQEISTFENVNVINSPLAPIIKFPLTGEIINNDLPVLRGIGIPGTTVNIYTNEVLDGGTVVDVDGNWEYQLVNPLPSYNPGFFDGLAVVKATNTDLTDPIDTINLIIDTTVVTPIQITYPSDNESLYNNKPLIKGTAPAGTNIDINLDGVLLASVVTDNSCRWRYKVVTPLTNLAHTLDIGGALTHINVNSFTDHPLITYIGSELDGFPIVNNMPLIEGVGIPGTVVSIWLNYVSYQPIGTVLIDPNGNWSFQTIPTSYADPLSGLPVTQVPIPNGLNIISTLLVNDTVNINVVGYQLNRPAYDTITGVIDNTVFNTRLSNRRMLNNHKSLLSAIMNKQRSDIISFQKHDKNPNLVTTLGTEVVIERADIRVNSLGAPIAILEYANVKCIARKTYAQILNDFNNGGTVKGMFKGKPVYMLPIGQMKMKSILDDVQEWKLLISPQTTYSNLLNLYKNGLTVNLMTNSIFHSDANSLHMVEYNYVQPDKYNFKTIYQDWFSERNNAWILNPHYMQKYQSTEIIIDQIITNGVSDITLKMYRCLDATLVQSFAYAPVAPAPIPIPEVVMEVQIDWSDYDPDQYFFVWYVGVTAIGISERIDMRAKWRNTILIESENSVNMPGVFYSTGFKSILRIEGLVKKLQPNVDFNIAEEESGNTKLLYSRMAKKRMIRYGTAYGLPDYLALKVANAIINDLPLIEAELYTLEKSEKIKESEDVDGHPLYYYEVIMTLQDNSQGKVFAGVGPSDTDGVILVVDASAIGLPPDVLIDISEE